MEGECTFRQRNRLLLQTTFLHLLPSANNFFVHLIAVEFNIHLYIYSLICLRLHCRMCEKRGIVRSVNLIWKQTFNSFVLVYWPGPFLRIFPLGGGFFEKGPFCETIY